MAFNDNSKIDKSFKTLINKEFSNTGLKFFEEAGADTININSGEVWSSEIPTTPSIAVSEGVAKRYELFTLSPRDGYTDSSFYLASGSSWTPGDNVDRPFINENLLQKNLISDKYGSDYEVRLFDNDDNEIFTSDPISWYFDYQTGVLNVQNPGAGNYSTPYKVTVYQYTGRTVEDNRTLGYSGSFSGSFQGDGSGLTNLPADAIVGLNLSQIALGTVTGSVDTGNTSFTLESGSNTLFTIDNQGGVNLESLKVQGDLEVVGTASFQETTNTTIADRFILLASGSQSPTDGGIVVQQDQQGIGELFGFDFETNRWAFTSSFDGTQSGFNPDLFVAGVLSGSANDSDPTNDTIDSKFEAGGNIYIGTDESIWMYS